MYKFAFLCKQKYNHISAAYAIHRINFGNASQDILDLFLYKTPT